MAGIHDTRTRTTAGPWAPVPHRHPTPGRAVTIAEAQAALACVTDVPAITPARALARLDDTVERHRDADPGLRALLLRHALVGHLAVAGDPHRPAGDLRLDDRIGVLLDDLLALVVEHGLSLFAVDAQSLLARRALLHGDEDGALAAMSTALSYLEEPALVDHSPTTPEHRHNRHGAHRLAANTLVSLGMHDVAEPLLERARDLAAQNDDGFRVAVCDYERIRLSVSWGLRLKRAGRHGTDRLEAAARAARELRVRGVAAHEHRALLRAALVLARAEPGPAPDTPGRHVARQDAAAMARLGIRFPSQHDRLLSEFARARALERAGRITDAAAVLETLRARRPRGEPSLMLSITRERARLHSLPVSGPSSEAVSTRGDYIADLEAELWSLHQARVLSLQTRMAHDRLRREHGHVAALALADPLTGLPNRRALDAVLARTLIGPAPRLAVAMIDVDRFKRINDAVSHTRGDEVLRLVATALRSSLRADDTVARYGGDEFVVVLPDTGGRDAGAALERAARAVSGVHAGDGEGVTLSVGVIEVGAGERPDTVLARADAVMYAVKRSGGGAVRVEHGDGTAPHDGPSDRPRGSP